MTTKTITTQKGSTITVEMERKVQDKISYADGYKIVTGREIVDTTKITFRDASGKTLGSGNRLERHLSPRFDAKSIAAGAVGKVGNIYLLQETYDLVSGLLADVEAETPKSDEQIAIETAQKKAEEDYMTWYNSPEAIRSRKLEQEMDREDSDY